MLIRSMYFYDSGRTEVPRPTWPQIEHRIRALDFASIALTIGDDESANMLIDGGKDGYVVQATLDNIQFYYFMNPRKLRDPIEREVSGQLIECPANRVCTLDWALKAARTFAFEGRIDAELNWDLG